MLLKLNCRRFLSLAAACCLWATAFAGGTADSARTGSAVQSEKKSLQRDPFVENGALGHFTWGVDLGSGVDLTSHDMTMFELEGCFGYKNRWFRFAGVGASVVSMMNNSSRCYPVFGMVRTSFSPFRRLCFMELRAGVSFNSMMDYPSQTDFYGSLGVGFTLAHSRKFSSHVVLRAVYMPLTPVEIDGVRQLGYDLGYAAIGIGCSF